MRFCIQVPAGQGLKVGDLLRVEELGPPAANTVYRSMDTVIQVVRVAEDPEEVPALGISVSEGVGTQDRLG